MAFAIEDPEANVDQPVVSRKRQLVEDEMDITPMIDCVFLLLIFFTVTSSPDAQTALNLAPARHGIGVSERNSVAISIADEGGKTPAVYLGPDKGGQRLSDDPARQAAEIKAAVEAAARQGKVDVVIKAERTIKRRDVARVGAAAAAIDGVRLNLAVFETE